MVTLSRTACVLLVTLLCATLAQADTIGPTYPIVEKDMLEEIERSLREKERNGEIARLQNEAIERSKRSIENPAYVDLPRATRARTFHYDPSIRVQDTIYDHEGRVVAAAGTLVNPLTYVSMSQHLLFFDGTDPVQVAMVNQLHAHYGEQVKLILTKGQPLEMTRQRKAQVYFDQGASLIRKLGISAVPTLVSQEGMLLRLDELEVKP